MLITFDIRRRIQPCTTLQDGHFWMFPHLDIQSKHMNLPALAN